ncbi:MAG TPA: TonB-dependent receptor [Cyclobacteriaceae bacterium]|nr:TonB-dependent receptor [Cyclobacteriaceae bacterium]
MMYIKLYCLMAAMWGIPFLSVAQERFTVSGNVRDGDNGEELIGATVLVQELNTGGVTNEYGFFSLTLPKGQYNLVISFVGYESVTEPILLDENLRLNIELMSQSSNLEEVVVTSDRPDANVRSTSIGVNKLDVREIEVVPVVFGEKDIIKTLQFFPGIKSSEGGGGFFVRGGSADQNLIMLDEAPVYNASHLLGFFSVFNSDAIKDLSIYKGHIPAEYGGRASSVLDIRMKDGNSKKFNASGGIGLISSRLALEGPIEKDKSSFIVSGRRTYADVFLKLSNNEDLSNSILYFYDLNAKANYQLNPNNRIYLSGYFGRDKFGFADVFGFDWGNTTATLRWNHLFNDKLFLNSTVLFSDYNYEVDIGGDEGENNGFRITSAIRDFSIKEDFDYFINPRNTLKFGANLIRHSFMPGAITTDQFADVNASELQKKAAWEGALYASHDLELSRRFLANYGLRYSYFAQVGPGDIFTYNENGEVTNIERYGSGEVVQTYGGLEPRIGLTHVLNDESSVKASFGRNRQYLHLLSNSNSGTPIDLWIPSSNNVKPQFVDQYAAGYYRNFQNNTFESSVELYYKDMQNQIDYKTGAELVYNENVESQLLFGKGWSYGAEFFLKKNSGDLTGWISYTWSKTERKFAGVDQGRVYPANQDRRHDLAVVGIYQLNSKWTLSASFVYYTGNAVTFPIGKYEVEGKVINLYDKRNANRYPDYHRLDLGATLQLKETNNFSSDINFSVYNAYARKNAYSINFREVAEDPSRTEVVKLSLFNILPSITYNFKFK